MWEVCVGYVHRKCVCACMCVCLHVHVCVCTIVCTGIEQSFKDGCWADESSFEVKGAATLSNVYVTEAPRRARENRALLVRELAVFLLHWPLFCGVAVADNLMNEGVIHFWMID